jgi:hypothetical protein
LLDCSVIEVKECVEEVDERETRRMKKGQELVKLKRGKVIMPYEGEDHDKAKIQCRASASGGRNCHDV